MDPIGFTNHDHAACISDNLARVDEKCSETGLQFTPVRRRVLEILLEEHRALGAYDILDKLRKEGLGSQPPVAYRALDFLVSNGFAHKIENLNAFIACNRPGDEHAPAFLICLKCDSVAETHTELTKGQIGRVAKDASFQIDRIVVEVEGVCPQCQEVAE